MPIVFDPVNKLIRVTSPTTTLTAQDLYNSSMSWAENLDNFIYDVPMDAAGFFSLGGGVRSDAIYRLLKDWKLKWYDGDKTVQVAGTLITDDNTPRTVPPDSGSVEVIFQVVSAGTIQEPLVSVDSTVVTVSSVTEFTGDADLSDVDDFYNGSVMVFTAGQMRGIARKVTDYIGLTRTFRFLGGATGADAPWPVAPAVGDRIRLIGRIA